MSDIRQEVTDRVIAAMEKGTQWTAGWHRGQANHNFSTGEPYRGINQLLLAVSEHPDSRWLTFKQADAMGMKIRKGEHGSKILKMVEVERRKAREGENTEIIGEDDRKALVMKAYTVFNGTQIEGMPPLPMRENKVQPIEAVDAIVKGMESTGLDIRTIGSQPCYVPALDVIKMPRAGDFFSSEDYHQTLLHEVCHATGHAKRQNRALLFSRFGSDAYAREELRAELAATLTLSEVGFLARDSQSKMEEHAAAYLSSWLKVLKQDKNEIFMAASDAQKICDYLRPWVPKPVPAADQAPAPSVDPDPANEAATGSRFTSRIR